MSNPPPTRWGIASAGLISFDFANSLTTSAVTPGAHTVVAVAARDAARAADFAKAFDIPRAHGSYAALAADSDVDVVYVGAINPAHIDICRMMIQAGKHVLCEKPLGMNVRETKEMVAMAREKGVFLMEAMWARLQPGYLRLKEELDKGTIGEVVSSSVTFGQKITAARISDMALGGGTVLDLGVYTVFFSQLAHGGARPAKVVAAGHLNAQGTDESVAAVLTYAGGRTATLATHSRVVLPCEAEVFGTKGSLKLGCPFWCSPRLTTPAGVEDFAVPAGKHPFNFTNSAWLGLEAEHVRECLAKGLLESPRVTLDESVLVAEIMEDIRKQVGVKYPQD